MCFLKIMGAYQEWIYIYIYIYNYNIYVIDESTDAQGSVSHQNTLIFHLEAGSPPSSMSRPKGALMAHNVGHHCADMALENKTLGST